MTLQIIQWPSPLFGYPQGSHGRQGHAIQGIVYHTMDGYWSYYVEIIAGKVTIRNSANYSINRDGTIHQHCADADAAWCNGPMSSPDLSVPWIKACWDNHVNPNLVTLSIECEGRSGEAWTAAQTASLIEWSRAKIAEHHLAPDRLHLVSHHQIYAPKTCPGPSFPWTKLLPALQSGSGNVLGTPDIWTVAGFGSGIVAYCKAHPEVGLPLLAATTVVHWDGDHWEYAKTINKATNRVYLVVYRAGTGQIDHIPW